MRLDAVGNASSVHREGRAAHARIEAARSEVARLVDGDAKLVTFTSGGTEANDTVLTPDWTRAGKPHGFDRLLVGATEHPSVLAGGRFPAGRVEQIPVDRDGIVDLAALRALLSEGRAGSRLGDARQQRDRRDPAGRRGRRACSSSRCARTQRCHPGGGTHSCRYRRAWRRRADALGAQDRRPARRRRHRQGERRTSPSRRFSIGGGQERRGRAGTENVAAIAGFGVAAEAGARRSRRCA